MHLVLDIGKVDRLTGGGAEPGMAAIEGGARDVLQLAGGARLAGA